MTLSTELAGTPVLILREGASRSRGREAQHASIMAARIVAEAVKSALGPKGMDKMLVDSFGDVTITSDGRTVLDEMDIQHPAAKMMVEVAKTQDDEVGDGTTTAVIISGELLDKAEDLIEKNVQCSFWVRLSRLRGSLSHSSICSESSAGVSIPLKYS